MECVQVATAGAVDIALPVGILTVLTMHATDQLGMVLISAARANAFVIGEIYPARRVIGIVHFRDWAEKVAQNNFGLFVNRINFDSLGANAIVF